MKSIAALTVVVLAALALSGCSAGSAGNYELPSAVDGGMGSEAYEGSDDYAGGDFAGGDKDYGGQLDSPRSQVITGYLTVTADDPAAASTEAARIVLGVGGRVDGRREYAPVNGDLGSAQLLLRIPASDIDATIEKLKALGEPVELVTNADDVTAQVKDVDARVASLRASVDRLTTLLASAKDVASLVSIEASLTERQADLESMLAQQRALADQVSLATITLNLISEADAPPPPAPASFLTGLETGWNAFVAFISGLIVLLGVLLPWLVFLGLIGGAVLLIVRRRKRRTAQQ